MKARIRKGMLTITLAVIDPPKPSRSGKRLLIATTHGFRRTAVIMGNQHVTVSVNACVRSSEEQDKKGREIRRQASTSRPNKR